MIMTHFFKACSKSSSMMIFCDNDTKFELYGRGKDVLEDDGCENDRDFVGWH